jgi:hypothetical protein
MTRASLFGACSAIAQNVCEAAYLMPIKQSAFF